MPTSCRCCMLIVTGDTVLVLPGELCGSMGWKCTVWSDPVFWLPCCDGQDCFDHAEHQQQLWAECFNQREAGDEWSCVSRGWKARRGWSFGLWQASWHLSQWQLFGCADTHHWSLCTGWFAAGLGTLASAVVFDHRTSSRPMTAEGIDPNRRDWRFAAPRTATLGMGKSLPRTLIGQGGQGWKWLYGAWCQSYSFGCCFFATGCGAWFCTALFLRPKWSSVHWCRRYQSKISLLYFYVYSNVPAAFLSSGRCHVWYLIAAFAQKLIIAWQNRGGAGTI